MRLFGAYRSVRTSPCHAVLNQLESKNNIRSMALCIYLGSTGSIGTILSVFPEYRDVEGKISAAGANPEIGSGDCTGCIPSRNGTVDIGTFDRVGMAC